jgi:hypothetical protein
VGWIGRGGPFRLALKAFAQAYADVNEHDWEALRQAIADGRLAAADGA